MQLLFVAENILFSGDPIFLLQERTLKPYLDKLPKKRVSNFTFSKISKMNNIKKWVHIVKIFILLSGKWKV